MRTPDGSAVRRCHDEGMSERRPLPLCCLLLAALVVLAGCGDERVAPARLERDVATSFGNLFAAKRTLLGLSRARPLETRARCRRIGPQQAEVSRRRPDIGPGTEWSCSIRYRSPEGAVRAVGYRVEVRKDACWSATVASFRGERLRPVGGGRRVLDPLYVFQGCLPI